MTRIKFMAFSFLCVWLFVSFEAVAQQKMWVSSESAKLKSEKRSSSATIATLPYGSELKVRMLAGRWYKVSTASGKNGWIYRGRVSDTPPEAEDEDGGFLDDLPGTSIHADSSDTSRSIRGLSPEAAAYANSSKTPQKYRQALDQVMAVKTDKKEVEAFLKTGKIGEYAQ